MVQLIFFNKLAAWNYHKKNPKCNLESQITVTNGASMVSSKTTHLPITYLRAYAKKCHGFNNLASGFICSVRQACNNNWNAVFDKNSVKIFKSKDVSINRILPPIIQVRQNAQSQPLYSVFMSTHLISVYKATTTTNASSI